MMTVPERGGGKCQAKPGVGWVLFWCLRDPPVSPLKLGDAKVLGRGCSCGSGYEQPWESLGGHSRAVGRGKPILELLLLM